jgi:KDO2-lipid IV(A) lauroyltransferase
MPFCGSEARMPTGAVELALRTGAELIPAFVHRERGFHYHAYMGPRFDIIRSGDEERDVWVNSANLLSLFERHLRSDPGQWAVLEPVWPEDSSEDASPHPGTVE